MASRADSVGVLGENLCRGPRLPQGFWGCMGLIAALGYRADLCPWPLPVAYGADSGEGMHPVLAASPTPTGAGGS